jgi:hypothetical protein
MDYHNPFQQTLGHRIGLVDELLSMIDPIIVADTDSGIHATTISMGDDESL